MFRTPFARVCGIAGLSLGLALAVAPKAQAQFYEPIRVGIKGGATYSTVTDGGEVDSPNYTWGFLGGLVLSAKFNENIGIQPELLYIRKGFENSYTGDLGPLLGGPYDVDAKVRLDYIQLPVLLTANAGPLQFQFGPYVSYLVNSDFEVQNNETGDSDVSDIDVDDFNRWDFGLSGGVAFDFTPIQVGVRADWGFTDVGNTDENNQELRVAGDNQNLSFNVYAAFVFGAE